MPSALIFGCGPTGLVAAHACATRGVDFVVASKKRKSFLFGSQYLHKPIPGIVREEEGQHVKYVNVGSPEEYRAKTHGKYWDGVAKPSDFETDHMAWNIREAYDRLWQKYSGRVKDYTLPANGEGGLSTYQNTCFDLGITRPLGTGGERGRPKYDLVISTVPRKIWAVPGDGFTYSEGWALGDAPENGIFVPYEVGDNMIICDGSDLCLYNRLSKVFGYTTVEWPASVSEDVVQMSLPKSVAATRFTKPLKFEPSTTNDNPTAEWLHVGRFGKWQQGYIVTDAWDDVNNKLDEMGVAR